MIKKKIVTLVLGVILLCSILVPLAGVENDNVSHMIGASPQVIS